MHDIVDVPPSQVNDPLTAVLLPGSEDSWSGTLKVVVALSEHTVSDCGRPAFMASPADTTIRMYASLQPANDVGCAAIWRTGMQVQSQHRVCAQLAIESMQGDVSGGEAMHKSTLVGLENILELTTFVVPGVLHQKWCSTSNTKLVTTLGNAVFQANDKQQGTKKSTYQYDHSPQGNGKLPESTHTPAVENLRTFEPTGRVQLYVRLGSL